MEPGPLMLDESLRDLLFKFQWGNAREPASVSATATLDLGSVRDVEAALSCTLHPEILALLAVAGTVMSEYVGSIADLDPLTRDARNGHRPIADDRIAIGAHPDRHAWYLVTADGKSSRIIERDNFDGNETRHPLAKWLEEHLWVLLDERTPPTTPAAFRIDLE